MTTTTEMNLEREAETKLREAIETVPFVSIGMTETQPCLGLPERKGPDFVLKVRAGKDEWWLACEVKNQAQPRQTRAAVLQMKDFRDALADPKVYPVLLAPYISPESALICRQAGVGYADFAGNCQLIFGKTYIERSGASNAKAKRRGLRSLFSPKAARILRSLLREPGRGWRVKDLQSSAGVSLGQVSNVRRALLDREWAELGPQGLVLTGAIPLLDEWRDAYKPRPFLREYYYTLLHGDLLERGIKNAQMHAGPGANLLLGSFSAARWLAPFARYPYQVFYANDAGALILRDQLSLEKIGRGHNVIVDHPADDGIFADGIEAAPGIWSTSVVQTYLDLHASGERGIEAAEHLRQHKIAPMWSTAQ